MFIYKQNVKGYIYKITVLTQSEMRYSASPLPTYDKHIEMIKIGILRKKYWQKRHSMLNLLKCF